MKKILLLAFVVLVALIVFNRQRVFVRDPFATVYQSQARETNKSAAYEDVQNEVKQAGVQVYFNYSNDVLLVRESGPGASRILVQNWSRMPGTPVVLKCIRWMACLTNADHAATLPIAWTGTGEYDPHVTMTSSEVSFVAGDGTTMHVVLR